MADLAAAVAAGVRANPPGAGVRPPVGDDAISQVLIRDVRKTNSIFALLIFYAADLSNQCSAAKV